MIAIAFNHDCSCRRPRARGTGAFTLIELLLATAIGAIVLLVINATFFSALRLHNVTHEKIDAELVVQRALGIIRQDLAGIMIPANPQATTNTFSGQLATDSNTMVDLDSTGERITPDLHTSSGRIDGWTPFAEVQSVCYFLIPANDGGPAKALVRVATRNLLPATSEDQGESRILLTGVTSAGMSFHDGTDWVDTWDTTATNMLPSAIKFSIVMAPRDNSARADPAPIELVVPVLVKTTVSAQQENANAAASP